MMAPQPQPQQQQDEAYFDLGHYRLKITTTVTGHKHEQVLDWFNRGLIWSYAFNHEEAITCFGCAIEIDPKCSMAYWGLAYALGLNYNKPWEAFGGDGELTHHTQAAHQAAGRALEHSHTLPPIEQLLVKAIAQRYPLSTPPKIDREARWREWNQAYADAMYSAHTQYPEDLDITALYADALMNLTPWKLWDIQTGLPCPGAHAIQAKTVLEHALNNVVLGASKHPGILHVYIHLMEMSSAPEAALPAAAALDNLVPDAGHLQHMSSHISVLCGHYEDAISSNTRAIAADEKWFALRGSNHFYTLYRCHDYHFLVYAAMFAGQRQRALEAVDGLEKCIPKSVLSMDSPFPMADWLEGFMTVRMHVYVRFGMWDAILDLQSPSDQKLYCTATAMTHYAKGIAHAAQSQLVEANLERDKFTTALTRVPDSRTIFNNTCIDILAIAGAMLDAEIEFRIAPSGSFVLFDKAVQLADDLPYDEPWGWMQPPRHAYAALLLEDASRKHNGDGHHDPKAKIEKAANMYRGDLGLDQSLPRAHQHPLNVWALHGYYECLMKLLQADTQQGHQVKKWLDQAIAKSDVNIKNSCFCRAEVD